MLDLCQEPQNNYQATESHSVTKSVRLYQIGLLITCAILSSVVQAQAHLIPGAFRQLQQLVLPDHDHANIEASGVSQKPTLEQLKEEASQLEAQLTGLTKEENALSKQTIPNYNRMKVKELEQLLTSLQLDREQWLFKKELSEEASVQLSRERLKLQSELHQLEHNGRHDNSENHHEQFLQLLHNLSLKMRFAEQFQAMAGRRLESITSQKQQVQSIYEQQQARTLTIKDHQPPQSDDSLDTPHLYELKQRLSQTRNDLIQLQNFYYEVKYQLEQVHNVELLYKIMLRQKQRLKSIPAEQSARHLQQNLKIRRYLLLEEKAALSANDNQGEKNRILFIP